MADALAPTPATRLFGIEVPVVLGPFGGMSSVRLAAAVSDALSQDFLDLEFRFSVSNGRLLAYLAKYGEVISRTFSGDHATVHCRLSRQHLGALRDDPEIEIHPYVAAPMSRHGAEGAVGEVA